MAAGNEKERRTLMSAIACVRPLIGGGESSPANIGFVNWTASQMRPHRPELVSSAGLGMRTNISAVDVLDQGRRRF